MTLDVSHPWWGGGAGGLETLVPPHLENLSDSGLFCSLSLGRKREGEYAVSLPVERKWLLTQPCCASAFSCNFTLPLLLGSHSIKKETLSWNPVMRTLGTVSPKGSRHVKQCVQGQAEKSRTKHWPKGLSG